MSQYQPSDIHSRLELASKLQTMLRDSGFTPEEHNGKEELWTRQTPHERFRVAVYTTIEDRAVRRKDADAIRVGVFYRGRDKLRFLAPQPKVLRCGDMLDIVSRVRDRLREAWLEGSKLPQCSRCGAPTFVSKRGNQVCAEICYKQGA